MHPTVIGAKAVAWVSAILLGCACSARAADAGAFEKLTGEVTVIGADNTPRSVQENAAIRAGDKVATGAKGEALIKMADDSTVVLRPNTQFEVRGFRYDKSADDHILFALLRGTARLISGLVAHARHSSVGITAGTATIGIRGTDFEVAVIPEDLPQARAGVYDYVHSGGTTITIASGNSLDVNEDQTAFAPDKPKPGEAPLQLLGEPPLFLQQGGGFDGLLQSLTAQPMNVFRFR